MSKIFESHVISYLGQLWNQVDIYSTTFNSAKLEETGESNYLHASDAGISFALDVDMKVKSIFLYSDGVENFKQYLEELPGGISFEMSRAQVQKAFGEPVLSTEVGGTGIMAIDFPLDRYESDTSYVSFEYTKDSAHIRLVAIGKS